MTGFEEDVMIALLPTTSDWCKQDLPHLTLAYLGKIVDLKPYIQNEALKMALSLSMIAYKIDLSVVGTDIFSDSTPVDVLRMESTPELLAMRSFVEQWDVSEHDFNPHCTVGPLGSLVEETIPFSICFDRILVSWGTDNVSYKLQCPEMATVGY